jgi:hypothetical protein
LPQRRLQDRIQALVARAVATEDPRELEDVIKQLQEALREHANRLRQLAVSKLTAKSIGR